MEKNLQFFLQFSVKYKLEKNIYINYRANSSKLSLKNTKKCICFPIPLLNPLCANFTKWSNTLKRFVGKLTTNCLSVFDNFCAIGA